MFLAMQFNGDAHGILSQVRQSHWRLDVLSSAALSLYLPPGWRRSRARAERRVAWGAAARGRRGAPRVRAAASPAHRGNRLAGVSQGRGVVHIADGPGRSAKAGGRVRACVPETARLLGRPCLSHPLPTVPGWPNCGTLPRQRWVLGVGPTPVGRLLVGERVAPRGNGHGRGGWDVASLGRPCSLRVAVGAAAAALAGSADGNRDGPHPLGPRPLHRPAGAGTPVGRALPAHVVFDLRARGFCQSGDLFQNLILKVSNLC